MARDHQASPRARGLREAIRALAATRHAVLISRTKAINELKSLIMLLPSTCAPACEAGHSPGSWTASRQ